MYDLENLANLSPPIFRNWHWKMQRCIPKCRLWSLTVYDHTFLCVKFVIHINPVK